MTINKSDAYGERIVHALIQMADGYQEIADGLRRIAQDVERIGEKRGLFTLTATDIVTDALRRIDRGGTALALLVRAAADYERHAGLEVDG